MMRNLKPKKFVVLVILVLQLILLSACGSGLSGSSNSEGLELTNLMPENKGNTIGNLRNFGWITNDNDYIYYMTFIGFDGTLNRRSIASGESESISAGIFMYLNVVDGFIYYVNSTTDNIYRMDIDGEQRERLSNTWVNFLFVLNDTIYAAGNYLFAMNLDGSHVRVLSENSIHSIYFYDNKIYYTTNTNRRSSLYRMDLNGENKELIFQGGTYMDSVRISSDFFVYRGNVYYIEHNGNWICKIDTSTQTWSILHRVGERIISANRKGNIIFYTSALPWTYHRIDLDTGEIISNGIKGTTAFHAIGDRIFFYDRETNERIYSMNIDGSDVRRFH